MEKIHIDNEFDIFR